MDFLACIVQKDFTGVSSQSVLCVLFNLHILLGASVMSCDLYVHDGSWCKFQELPWSHIFASIHRVKYECK